MTDSQWDRSAVDREASAWLVRLDDDPDNATLHAQLQQWLARSPAHRASWESTLDLSALIEAATPSHGCGLANGNAEADNVVVFTPRRPLRERVLRHWRGVGGLAAAVLIGLLAFPHASLRLRADAIAGTGEVRTVHLSDGSKVALSPGSALSFQSDGNSRNAKLLRGRAFFEVARDPHRPFRVAVAEATVTVLGTAFEIDLEDAGAAVAVRRGLVEVAYPERQLRDQLRPGEAIRFDWHGHHINEQVRPDRIAGWRDGQLFVRNRPIGEVLAELRSWYSGYIVTRGTGLATRRVTGIYDLRYPDAALAALAKAHALDVKQITPWIRIVTVN